MSLRDVRSQGLGRITAIIAAMMIALATMFAFTSMPQQALAADDSQTNFDSWTEVAANIEKQLETAEQDYNDGNYYQAGTDFQNAHWVGYDASNFSKVVNDTFGADKQKALLQEFTDLESLAYQQDQGDAITAKVDALTADLNATAQTLDADTSLADPKTYAKQRAEETAKERKKLDAAKKNSSKGKGDRTWSDVASEMNVILDKAYKAAISGKGAEGSSLVNNVYYQYYEKLGFEKNVMNAISGDRVSQVEYQFKMTRKTMRDGGSQKEIKKLVDDLKSWLVEDAATLDGGATSNVNSFTKFITSSVGQAFLILIREGLEALLVVAAVIAYLVKSGNKRFTKFIYLGVLAGLAGSGLIAVLFTFLFGGSGPIQEISEGVCALIAMAMLLWTSNWMLNKSSVEAWNRYIRNKTEAAVASAQSKMEAGEGVSFGMVVSLAMLSFLAVFREGAETVIFYESIYSMSQDSRGMWIGGIAAAVVLLIIFFVLRFTSVKIPIGPFFLVTSILMAVLVVIFAGGGIHALIEGDLIEGTYLSNVPTNDWIGLYPYVECLVAQALAAIAVITLFVVGFVKKRKLKISDIS
ncbi:FTR1 family iron permease [Bifidobacterium dentium]|uniref:FTR1 family iron permease n=1 Tax=Bifidobacterium dentium TaxID=1689 RepID=UPI0018B06820|nr:FTR1 family protein [Bifidobacterium dentium]MBF9666607.1 FTR1 family iron permease [Bifidobacterium dentium]MBF9695383.1 FTR1 family iron permease [Bifidobacterium dentium]MBF9711544.1 FTR1 family iron permease [Bifidobacterium dentium]MBF9713504.1 FTR1 family iron permease [Bifidobacterium dentium]MBF9717474.1 FTR1 family iron permease [Bifidobacterium dentium]